jgi:phenylalanyl-tRNA synthetase beta chain
MHASYKWLKELCAFDATPDKVAETLTRVGLEVEKQKRFGELPEVVVAEVRGKERHPKSDKLTLVRVFDGSEEVAVVCGAPNVPEPGKRILFARMGAKLPNGMEIGERKVAGVVSRGMICSEVELDIGAESDGIVVLPDDFVAAPGVSVSTALDLDDVVFEIGLTPNRPDCLGHVGLARELSAALGAPLRLPSAKVSTTPSPLSSLEKTASVLRVPDGMQGLRLKAGDANIEPTIVPVVVQDTARCPRYAIATVEGVQIAPSPFWLRYRLHVLGLRAINNAVDVTNLVLLEYGYPTHAFDLDLVQGGAIEVRTARAGERIDALDGVERVLDGDDLVICDARGPVAIAGVMGGQRSSIQAKTQRIAVECAYFDPRSVRRSSRRLGLHTDSSHRFERGVDPRAVPEVMARAVSLLCEIAGGRASAMAHEVRSSEFVPRVVTLRESRAEALLGVALPAGKAEQVLTALECEVEQAGPGILRVSVPTFRPDLSREEDLIEEVARIWGYDKIPSVVPSIKVSEGSAPEIRFLRKLRLQAAAVGLSEAVNYAFVAPKQLEKARVSTDALRLANPLSEERSVMRTSLLPGLLANVQRAQRHQVTQAALFELARTFQPTGQLLPEERYKLGVLLWGTRAEFIGEAGALDFFDAKGMLESIVRPLTRGVIETIADAALAATHAFLHPRRAARVRLFDTEVGLLGELHPDVLDDLELTGPVTYAELDVASVFAVSRGHLPAQVNPLPRFPGTARDLAIVVEEAVQAGTVAALLAEAGGPLVEAVELFDLYRGEQVGGGKKSLAFRIRYRDRDATLTDVRVDEVHGRILAEAGRRFGAQIRA